MAACEKTSLDPAPASDGGVADRPLGAGPPDAAAGTDAGQAGAMTGTGGSGGAGGRESGGSGGSGTAGSGGSSTGGAGGRATVGVDAGAGGMGGMGVGGSTGAGATGGTSGVGVTGRQVDLLLVVDNSPSMIEEQDSLRRGLPTLFAELGRIPGGLPDLHAGVASTDVGAGPSPIPGGCTRVGGDRGILQARPGCGLDPNNLFVISRPTPSATSPATWARCWDA
jgi:hypothetical protein